MNRRTLLATGLACPALASSTLLFPTLAWAAQPDPTARADALVRRFMAERHVPAAQVVVVRNGAIAFSRTYGVADLAAGTRATSVGDR